MFYKLFKKELKYTIYKPFIDNLKKPFELFFNLIIYSLIIVSSIIIFVNLLKGFSNYNLSKEILVLLISIFCLIEIFTSINKYRKVIFDPIDKSIILSLPIKSKDVILSKFLVLFIKEICFSCFLILPIIVSFLIVNKASASFYFFGILICLLISIVPLCLTLLYVFVFPKKEKITFLSFIFKLLVYVFLFNIYYLFIKTLLDFVNNNSLSFIFTIENATILQNITKSSIPLIFIGNILIGNNVFLNILLLVLVDSLLVLLILFLAKKAFKKENFEEEVYLSNKNLFKSDKNPLLKKEFILLTRKEDFFYNYLFILISVPFLCYFQMMVINDLIVETFGMNYRLPFALMTIILITCISNVLGVNILQNEGENYNMMKTFPITLKKQVLVKLLIMLGLLFVSNFTTLIVLLLKNQIVVNEFFLYFLITLFLDSGILVGAFNKTISKFKKDHTTTTVIKIFMISFIVLIISLVFNLVYDLTFIYISVVLLVISVIYLVFEYYNFKQNLEQRLEVLLG